jgi:hypothetical protein
MNDKARWAIVILFATAMAWMESATVVYLRLLVGRIDPYQANPLPESVGLGATELVREAATLVMLFAAGWLAGRDWRRRAGYFALAFGVWDILYYVFLALIGGWPRSVFDWDILFLLPLPWWGPVIAPASIATLMIAGGTLVTQFENVWPSRAAWAANLIGVALALFVFMADAIAAVGNGIAAIRATLPTQFLWPLFLVALVLMAAPIVDVLRQLWHRRARMAAASSSGT